MSKLNVKESIEIETSADKTWKIIGPDFVKVGTWGRGINKSWENKEAPVSIKGAPAGGRYCEIPKFGVADEKIIHYDEEKREISWSAIISKMPGFVKNLQNEIKVESLGRNRSKVTTNITAELKGVGGLIMGGMIKKNMDKLLKGFVKDWKAYAETGEVSETKKREMATAKS